VVVDQHDADALVVLRHAQRIPGRLDSPDARA
jgi:hypothetical protein